MLLIAKSTAWPRLQKGNKLQTCNGVIAQEESKNIREFESWTKDTDSANCR